MTVVRHGYIAAFNGVAGFPAAFAIMLGLAVAGAIATFAAVRMQQKRYQQTVAEIDPMTEAADCDQHIEPR